MFNGQLDAQVCELFDSLIEETQRWNVDRVNSTMLLKEFLIAKESPLYDALLLQMEDTTYFPEMVEETYSYLPEEPLEDEVEESQMNMVYNYKGQSRILPLDEDLRSTMELLVAWIQVRDRITLEDFTAIFVVNSKYTKIAGFFFLPFLILFSKNANLFLNNFLAILVDFVAKILYNIN